MCVRCVYLLVCTSGRYFIHGNFDVPRFITFNIYMNEEASVHYMALPNMYGLCDTRYSGTVNRKSYQLTTIVQRAKFINHSAQEYFIPLHVQPYSGSIGITDHGLLVVAIFSFSLDNLLRLLHSFCVFAQRFNVITATYYICTILCMCESIFSPSLSSSAARYITIARITWWCHNQSGCNMLKSFSLSNFMSFAFILSSRLIFHSITILLCAPI